MYVVNEQQVRDLFKDSGGYSGRTVNFTRHKNKALKALKTRQDILPKEIGKK